MSFLRGNVNATQHPAEVIVSVLEQDRMGNPTLWIGGDNRVYGLDERGQIADFTDWYAAQQNQYAPNSNRGFGMPGSGYDRQNYGQQGYGYAQGGYEPSPATSPRGFSNGNRNMNSNANSSFGYEDYGTATNTIGGGNRAITNPRDNSNFGSTASTVGKTTKFNREKRDVVIEDFRPLAGSEMIPLYDEDREELDVDYDYDNKYFKLIIK